MNRVNLWSDKMIKKKACEFCGCYTKGRHKIWCESEEAKKIKAQLVDRLSTAIAWG